MSSAKQQRTEGCALVITALPEERDAVLAMLRPYKKTRKSGDPATYFVASADLHFSSNPLEVIVLCLHGYSESDAAVATSQAVKSWSPDLVMVIGIAGGFRANKAKLGDVLVADSVVDYERQKLTVDGPVPRYRGWPTYAPLLSSSINLLPEEIAHLLPSGRPSPGHPSILHGPIASGNKIIEDPVYVSFLLRSHPKLIGCEMEAAGVATSNWYAERSPPFFMVRGVSDLANEEKSTEEVEGWRTYACEVAAVYGLRLLKDFVPPRPTNHPNQEENLETLRERIFRRRRERSGPSLRRGDTLGCGRYELKDQIGMGGFGVVWKAIDLTTNEVVALKVLHHQWTEDASRVERFRRGAQQMLQLRHPHVVRVLQDVEMEDGCLFFVMEYIDGRPFRDVVMDDNVDTVEKLSYLFQVCRALEVAHERGIVHRDLNPGNVIVSSGGSVKLTDFDLVLAGDTTGGTRTGAVMGTLFFSAPEALENAGEVDARADVYSLGMLLVFAMVGPANLMAFTRDYERMIGTLKLPSSGRRAVRRSTSFERAHRYPDVSSFRKDLARALWAVQSMKEDADWILSFGGSDTWPLYRSVEELVQSGAWWKLIELSRVESQKIVDRIMSSRSEDVPWGEKLFEQWLRGELEVSSSNRPLGAERVFLMLVARKIVLVLIAWIYKWSPGSEVGRLDVLLAFMLGYGDRRQGSIVDAVNSGRYLLSKDRLEDFLNRIGLKLGALLSGDSSGILRADEEQWLKEIRAVVEETGPPHWFSDDVRVEFSFVPDDDGWFVSEVVRQRKHALDEAIGRVVDLSLSMEDWVRAVAGARSQGGYRVRNLEEWTRCVEKVRLWKRKCQWTNTGEIAAVLRTFSSVENHAIFPNSGGHDLEDARLIEQGVIEMTLGSTAYVGRPVRLTLEEFESDITGEWAYLFLEFAVMEPMDEGADKRLIVEDVRESFPGEYVSLGDTKSYFAEGRRVARILGGNMIVVSKSSLYNLNSGTYDSRQGAQSQSGFRRYVESVIRSLVVLRILPDQFGNVARLDGEQGEQW